MFCSLPSRTRHALFTLALLWQIALTFQPTVARADQATGADDTATEILSRDLPDFKTLPITPPRQGLEYERDGGISSGSGGGAGILYRDTGKVEMLDTYEGRILNGHTYQGVLSVRGYILKAYHNLRFEPNLQVDFLRGLRILARMARALPKGVVINMPGDLGKDEAVLKPFGSEIIAVGYYESKRSLVISTELYERMDDLGKAAFWVHEALYLIARERRGLSFSLPVRRMTAVLLNKSASDGVWDWEITEFRKYFQWRSFSMDDTEPLLTRQPLVLKKPHDIELIVTFTYGQQRVCGSYCAFHIRCSGGPSDGAVTTQPYLPTPADVTAHKKFTARTQDTQWSDLYQVRHLVRIPAERTKNCGQIEFMMYQYAKPKTRFRFDVQVLNHLQLYKDGILDQTGHEFSWGRDAFDLAGDPKVPIYIAPPPLDLNLIQ